MAARGEVTSAETLGRILQQWLLVTGLTQRKPADHIETDQQYIWELESGTNMIVLERIFQITRKNGVRLCMEIDSAQEGQPGGTLEGKRMAHLRVELCGEIVGHLVGANRRTFDAVTLANAIETFGLGSTILLESVPFDLVVNRGSSDL